jgi:hypothetical protein
VEWSVRIRFPYLILWLLLKVPALLQAPQVEAVWLGFGELAGLVAGGWVLFATLAGLRQGSPLTFATGENSIHLARMHVRHNTHRQTAHYGGRVHIRAEKA